MGLITISDLTTYLKDSTIETDTSATTDAYDLYMFLIEAVSKRMERICNRKFAEAEYTEYLDGCGSTDLLVKNYPIVSLTSACFTSHTSSDPSGGTETEIDVDDIDIYYDEGRLYYGGGWMNTDCGGGWGTGRQGIKVVYTAGYDPIPEDLKLVCCKLVKAAYDSTQFNPNVTSESLGDYSYTLADAVEIGAKEKMILADYTRYEWIA